jgi:hypothetical protein
MGSTSCCPTAPRPPTRQRADPAGGPRLAAASSGERFRSHHRARPVMGLIPIPQARSRAGGRRVNPVGLQRATARETESWKKAIAKDIGFLALTFWPLALTWGFPFEPGPGVLAWLLGGAAEVLWLVVLAGSPPSAERTSAVPDRGRDSTTTATGSTHTRGLRSTIFDPERGDPGPVSLDEVASRMCS